MKTIARMTRMLAMFAVAGATVLAGAGAVAADKIHLKDGRVIEGTIDREGEGFLYLKTMVGGIEHVEFFDTREIVKIERDEKPAEAPRTDGIKDTRGAQGRAARAEIPGRKSERIAILNYGPPSSWGKDPALRHVGSTVGMQIAAVAFKNAIPLLEKDGVTTVVVRINSGGGYLLEISKFHEVFQKEYKKRFRTVAWVESAISAAAMGPWVIEEFYMMPDGNIGACTGWYGALQAVKDAQLEVVLALMEDASRKGQRDPKIMRSMQILEPLSADIDPVTGKVTWHQDTSGKHLVNPADQILTFTANDAVRFRFARGIALTPQDLAREIFGPGAEYEFAGKAASDYIDRFMIDTDKAEKGVREVFTLYERRVAAASAEQDRQRRGALVAEARRYLNQIRAWVTNNPNLEWALGINKDWFDIQDRRLRDLLK